jgi:hypothetical protein
VTLTLPCPPDIISQAAAWEANELEDETEARALELFGVAGGPVIGTNERKDMDSRFLIKDEETGRTRWVMGVCGVCGSVWWLLWSRTRI